HVVTVTGPAKLIYTAGQLARDAAGKIVGPGDMRAQLEQTFKNLDACLKAAGATWADVVKTNTFVTDYEAFSQCRDVRMRYLGVATPTARRSRSAASPSPRRWSRSNWSPWWSSGREAGPAARPGTLAEVCGNATRTSWRLS